MKNLIVVLSVISLLFAFDSQAQFLTGFGIKAGATFSNHERKYKPEYSQLETKNILGINAGIYTEMLMSKFFNIVIDAGYEQRGFTYEYIISDEFGNEINRYDIKSKTHYITIGVLGKIKYKTKTVTPYIIIGSKTDFYLDYTVNASDELNPEIKELFEYDYALEQFKKINYSINLGAGLEFEKLLPFKTLVEFNYSPPINTSLNNQGVEIKEHYFNIKLGINFIKEKTKKIKK